MAPDCSMRSTSRGGSDLRRDVRMVQLRDELHLERDERCSSAWGQLPRQRTVRRWNDNVDLKGAALVNGALGSDKRRDEL